ncbi:hypothetical protein [Endozoicomonas sp. 8E]|uniref:hypothetical protein n=1 Tax=Endozoicomonas sp. 8E TaxID=3035692 RepID=UPI002938E2C9|nr:hypothetical protein [Endozoicomonas sp. 8E]WOG26886.1 hypothetical protein P6910_20410 [Endozoicomonas sp. 8E]
MTRRFIVELERDAGSSKQNFSLKRDWRTLSGNPSDIAHINDYEQPGLPPYKKRHGSPGYGIEKTIIESSSWQWLCATNLLIAYELTVTTKVATRITTPYLSLPLEVLVAVAWFLKNYWNPDTRLFGTIEQQVNSIMTEGDHRFATITAVFGSTENSPQYQSSESSGQPASKATLASISSFISPRNNDYSGGNGGDQQQLHTLGLNCFIHPCHGFCQLKPLFESSESTEWPLNTLKISCVHLATGHCSSCMKHFDPAYASESHQNPFFNTLHDLSDIQLPFESVPPFDDIDGHLTGLIQNAIDATESLDDDVPMLEHLSSNADDFSIVNGSPDLQRLLKEDEPTFTLNPSETLQSTSKLSQLDRQPHLSRTGAVQAKADSSQKVCELTVVGEDGQQRPCWKVCKNARALSSHKSEYHRGQQTCKVTVFGEDGQQRPCGKALKNRKALKDHKNKYHSGQQTCKLIVFGEDGQQRPCGQLCKNVIALSNHKGTCHTGQKTCEVIVVGQDGQQRPCGKVCKNAGALSSHKSEYHRGQQTCKVTVFGEDGQQRPCGKVQKNTKALKDHKNKYHSGQQTCKAIVVGEEGQLRPCGEVFKNSSALSNHKSRYHSVQQTCEVIVFGEDGQRRPCGKLCKHAKALSNHKSKYHRGQQTCEVIMFGEGGQQRPCGKVFKSGVALTDHKRGEHSRQQTCEVILFGKDGQQRPCKKVCKSALALSEHKSRYHSGQQSCKVIVVGEDGQQRPCGKLCKNVRAMLYHKRSAHSNQQHCNLTVIEHGQQWSSGAVCKKTQTLSYHKRRDRKRKPAAGEDDELSPPADKVNKCD